jgi:protein-disulfide isomerase
MSDNTGSRLERRATIVLTVAALVMVATVVYREFVPRSQAQATTGGPQQPGGYNDKWRELSSFARPLGDSNSAVQVIEFVDLECGACRGFHEATLPEVRAAVGNHFSVSFVHLPLPGHRFAKHAAKASECAAEQDRFSPFIDVVLAKQDSIGLKAWHSYAQEAGVPRSDEFTTCLARAGNPSRVDSGIAAAQRMGIHATPTVLVNGWQVSLATVSELQRVITAIVENREPYPGRNTRGKQR